MIAFLNRWNDIMATPLEGTPIAVAQAAWVSGAGQWASILRLDDLVQTVMNLFVHISAIAEYICAQAAIKSRVMAINAAVTFLRVSYGLPAVDITKKSRTAMTDATGASSCGRWPTPLKDTRLAPWIAFR